MLTVPILYQMQHHPLRFAVVVLIVVLVPVWIFA